MIKRGNRLTVRREVNKVIEEHENQPEQQQQEDPVNIVNFIQHTEKPTS
jgi:hypothetical protein